MIKDKVMNQKVVPCTLIGDGMVGKTSLALAFVNRQPPDQTYVATVFDNYAGTVCVHGEQYTVSIFDSPGQHDYEGVRAYSYMDCEVVIICYSAADWDSFQNVKDVWIQETKSQIKRKKPILLLGCQTDIRTIESGIGQVTNAEGMQLAKEIGADAFLECSSSTLDGISEVFQTVINLALRKRKKKSRIINRLLRR